MVSVLQESAPSYTMVKNGLAYFNKDESCEDDPRPGRPVTVVTEENVRKIEKLVLADRRIKLWQIAEELQISKERVGEIIHEHMNMRKISARWVPKMLTPFDKQRRLQTSKDFLELVGDNIDEICDRIVTVDETWVRQYDPESKQESMQWTKKGERPPKKFKVQSTRGSRTEATWEVIARSAVLQDNASVHTARVSRQALKDTGFSEIDHPPYSPDLVPSDYFLFSNLKKELRGRRFVDDNQMKMAVESHFDCKEKEYFLGGLKALYTRYRASLHPRTTFRKDLACFTVIVCSPFECPGEHTNETHIEAKIVHPPAHMSCIHFNWGGVAMHFAFIMRWLRSWVVHDLLSWSQVRNGGLIVASCPGVFSSGIRPRRFE
ncbi:Histone-lysine N-methyltransferase SETMAR [Eumeta japonica]|uniref:Histone-lysine N-methyltransferase SETMAR n=1 Tax=Eumeta variegata TaxID=151549 RepID=A0A4C1SL41_EUMVA|nr:Histone-lysine N-methyltransferase SETMAR [Eumeta japonica]